MAQVKDEKKDEMLAKMLEEVIKLATALSEASARFVEAEVMKKHMT